MDCQIRDHGKILVQVDQTGLDAFFCADSDPSCNGKRTVKPGSTKHAAIALHIQFGILSIGIHLRIFFQLKARRIRMAADQLETVELLLRYGESDDGGIISCDKILSSRNDLPFFTFQKLSKAFFFKHVF